MESPPEKGVTSQNGSLRYRSLRKPTTSKNFMAYFGNPKKKSKLDVISVIFLTRHRELLKLSYNVNPRMPVVQKVADEVVFRRFQGEGVGFFNLTDPPSDF